VRVGDAAVISGDPVEFPNGRLVARAIDNRLGCFVAYETLRLLAEGDRPAGDFHAVAVNNEEVNGGGATTTAFGLEPSVALIIDGTHETKQPGVDERSEGEHAFGSGPAIVRGSTLSSVVFDLLVETAEAEDIPYTIEGVGGATHTDADSVVVSRAGVPTGSIGVPMRYMHSPVEMLQLDDLLATAQLCAAFTRRLAADQSFVPR
jgi:endoglucanase